MLGEIYECGLVAGIAGIILMIVPVISSIYVNLKKRNFNKQNFDEK